ncbi:MAG: UDP-N-acetylmuramate:L-alanyl-gamma-D-glutamyl-meso-diaminopimelate ligase [Burkholderiales bacterium]|nr:UDP-N-acetylmuramate:L-alanyl-gamma-D-glutamyl-meso-diaminopimelate ligase [Burkholderiales bacterium]
MHIHILGICGTFMGGIAALAKSSGHRVTGCDAAVYPPMSTQLEMFGIELIEGYDPAQIKLAPDLYVIGNVVSRGNPLMEAILDQNLPYVSGPQWLYENILKDKWVIAVAGTHGKTTTTSMLAWILEYGGLNPGFLIGGVAQNFGVSARLTDSPFFAIEADEYDTAFFDKRSKFVHYHPRTAVLNNLEYDHADIFPDLAAIETQFHHLVRTIPSGGLIVANACGESLRRVLERGCWSPVEWFGNDAGWHALLREEHTDILCGDKFEGALRWDLLGAHNRSNALAAIAAARHCGVPPETGIDALSKFMNVKRRMELRGIAGGVAVYDDFAHHPTAIATTLAGLREKAGSARIIAVLEPRSNTMKMGVMKDALAGSLIDADLVFCFDRDLGWDAKSALSSLGENADVKSDLEGLVEAIAGSAKPGDTILVMSNGSFGGIHQKLLAALG